MYAEVAYGEDRDVRRPGAGPALAPPAHERVAEPIPEAERVGPFEVVETIDTHAVHHEEPSAATAPSRRPRLFGIGNRLWAMTGEVDPVPLVILFLLFFFDEFDTGAFNTLAPSTIAIAPTRFARSLRSDDAPPLDALGARPRARFAVVELVAR